MDEDEVRGEGQWTAEEDKQLREYVEANGAKDWGPMATNLGIGKTANSCRNRWRNYLRPGIRLEDFTPQEMLIILNLRFHENEEMRRWSNIAKMLPPGRSDNHVKNFWNTRMKKEAKKLNCEVTSKEFHDKMTLILTDRIQAPDDHTDTMVIGGETTAAVKNFCNEKKKVAAGNPSFDGDAADDEFFSNPSCFWSLDYPPSLRPYI